MLMDGVGSTENSKENRNIPSFVTQFGVKNIVRFEYIIYHGLTLQLIMYFNRLKVYILFNQLCVIISKRCEILICTQHLSYTLLM